MLVKEIMTKHVVTIRPNNTVFESVLLYQEKKVGCLVVVENDVCVGIITERDIIERTLCVKKNPETTAVEDIMSTDIKTINALDTIETALKVMEEYNVKKLPVFSDDKLVGIITVTDISKARSDISKRFMESWVKPQWRD